MEMMTTERNTLIKDKFRHYQDALKEKIESLFEELNKSHYIIQRFYSWIGECVVCDMKLCVPLSAPCREICICYDLMLTFVLIRFYWIQFHIPIYTTQSTILHPVSQQQTSEVQLKP